MSVIHFSHPQYLLLLPLVWGFTWWVLRDSLAELGRARGRLAGGMRAALVTGVVLALAGIQFVRPTTSLCTAFVVDVSDSDKAQQGQALAYIQAAIKHKQPGDRLALVAFGAEALLDHAPDDPDKHIDGIYSLPNRTRTDIAAGIQMAMASFPQDSGKQVVLFTDGNENLGNAADQASLALASDVRISVVPLTRDTSHGEALLLRAVTPTEVKEGAPFQVAVVAESLKDADGKIHLYRNNTLLSTRSVHLKSGKTVVAFDDALDAGGLYRYRAVLDVPLDQDTIPDNNTVFAYTRVSGKPKVLIVEGTPGEGRHLAQALRAHDLVVETGGPDRIPAAITDCAQYDSLIFVNVPAWTMSPIQMAMIQGAVRDAGMGFAMIGGEQSFGAGGYFQTPIEEALPISMDTRKKKKFASMAVAMVIEDLEEQVIVNRSIEAAKAVTDMLLPVDQVGVEGCMDTNTWPIPMQHVSDPAGLKRQMDTQLRSLGDPPSYVPFLQEAARKLAATDANVRHIILVGDGDATYGDAAGVLEEELHRIRAMGITVSAISTGIDGPPAFAVMKHIAALGGGRAYEAKTPEELPHLLMRDEQSVSKPPLYEKSFKVLAEDTTHPATQGIDWTTAPLLRGYTITSQKEGALSARVLLSSPESDPVLATWQYGLGRSLAFTSDATAHWGLFWLDWPEFSSFWTRSLRWTLRNSNRAHFQTDLNEDHGRATIGVEALADNGDFRNGLDIRAHVSHVSSEGLAEPRAQQQVLALDQTAPGHYEANFETSETGAYLVTVETHDGSRVELQNSTLVIPYSPEYQTVQTNDALLEQIAERARGEVTPPAEDIYGRLRFGSRVLRDIWPALLALLAVAFLLDVAVRRILLPWREIFALTRDAVLRRLPAWSTAGPAPPAHTSTLGSLLDTKEKTRRPDDTSPTSTARLRELRRQAGEEQPDVSLAPPPTQPVTAEPAAPAEQAPTTMTGKLLQKKKERRGE